MKESKMIENSPRTGTERAESSKPINVPFVVYEAAQSRLERVIKRLWITTIILIVLLVGSNVIWIVYENSFEEVVVTQETELGGDNNYIGNDGDITNN